MYNYIDELDILIAEIERLKNTINMCDIMEEDKQNEKEKAEIRLEKIRNEIDRINKRLNLID